MNRPQFATARPFFPALLLALFTALCLSGLTACGQKGPLFMPPGEDAVESADQQPPAENTPSVPQDTADTDQTTQRTE